MCLNLFELGEHSRHSVLGRQVLCLSFTVVICFCERRIYASFLISEAFEALLHGCEREIGLFLKRVSASDCDVLRRVLKRVSKSVRDRIHVHV